MAHPHLPSLWCSTNLRQVLSPLQPGHIVKEGPWSFDLDIVHRERWHLPICMYWPIWLWYLLMSVRFPYSKSLLCRHHRDNTMVVRDTDFLWTGSYVIYFLLLTYPLQQALYVPFSDFSYLNLLLLPCFCVFDLALSGNMWPTCTHSGLKTPRMADPLQNSYLKGVLECRPGAPGKEGGSSAGHK